MQYNVDMCYCVAVIIPFQVLRPKCYPQFVHVHNPELPSEQEQTDSTPSTSLQEVMEQYLDRSKEEPSLSLQQVVDLFMRKHQAELSEEEREIGAER